ncbi:hypothetical protein Tco_0716773 [Tanacetum coccineum]
MILNSRGRQVIPFDHFINNDLAYLSGGVSSRTYATSVTKTKAADYGHIKWIEYLVPNTMWSEVPVNYDKHALWGISHWGRKRQQFYGFAANMESACDVYYKHDDKLYTFKEGYFKRLRLQDIEDMLILLVQGKLTNLNVEDHLAFGVSLRMFTRSIVIQRRVEDLRLGVKSYQKKLNITKSDTYRSNLKRRDAYTAYSNPRGFIYQNKDKKNKLMRIDELHKFSDGTLDDVRTALNDRDRQTAQVEADNEKFRKIYWWKTVSIHGIGVSIAEVVKVAGNVLSTEDIGLRFSRELSALLYQRMDSEEFCGIQKERAASETVVVGNGSYGFMSHELRTTEEVSAAENGIGEVNNKEIEGEVNPNAVEQSSPNLSLILRLLPGGLTFMFKNWHNCLDFIEGGSDFNKKDGPRDMLEVFHSDHALFIGKFELDYGKLDEVSQVQAFPFYSLHLIPPVMETMRKL